MKIMDQTIPDKIADYIRDMIIVTKELNVNDKLPSERELATFLGASRNSVREAIKILVAEGLLIKKRSLGTFISDDILTKRSLKGPLLLKTNKKVLTDWYEIRLVIEPSFVKTTAERATKKEIENIIYCGRNFCNNSLTYEELIEADIKFHTAIAEATHNVAISRLFPYIEESIKIVSQIAIENNYYENATKKAMELHEKIFECIKNRNGDKGSIYMQYHIINNLELYDKV